jgi:hypothetical protein
VTFTIGLGYEIVVFAVVFVFTIYGAGLSSSIVFIPTLSPEQTLPGHPNLQ